MEKVEDSDFRHAPPDELKANVSSQQDVSEPQEKKHYSFYLSILMLSMIGMIVSWDVTALSLALPIIADQLQGTNFQSFWASIAFILGTAVTQPIYASVSDVVGRKHVLYVSIFFFLVGSVIFATATNMNIVVVGRLIKGLGAGGLDVLQTIILCDITTLKERPRWLGVISVTDAIGVVTGPFLGGVFAEKVGWPWLGWINLITGSITGILAFFFLHLTPIEGQIKDRVRRLDWYGFAFSAVIGTTVALPLSWASDLYPWASWQTLLPLIIGLLLVVPFVFVEKRVPLPMVPYQIFDNISIITGMISGFLYGFSMNAVLLYVPLFFEAVFLETPMEAARSSLPLCCLFVSTSIIASFIIDWTRRYRLVLWAGWGLTTTFLGLNYIIGAETSRAQTYAFQALLGAGLGTTLVGTIITVLASVRKVDNEGLGAGMLVTVRFVGTLLGLAICSAVFSSTFSKYISSIQKFPSQIAVLEDASQAVGFIPQLREINVPEDIMQVVIRAYEKSFQTVWVVLAAFSALAALLSVLTRENSLEKEEMGRQGFNAPLSES
ncbi:MFS general substrate transporter [Lophiostoma macrostomum CBS 122681]|uniref:MFS general substrate transporter n=1 Tax=Lophiostoma macrostomum CBS 122681 TaxID=1314788 RepID=A0A6A6T8Q7_9PLEO|nr:MFS general substrate transporter [Lophiostoma macrostomum CBS 122681]